MAYWALPYRSDAVDRDPSFYCFDLVDDDHDGGRADDAPSSDFFGQFVDFGGADVAVGDSAGDDAANHLAISDALLIDQLESTGSSGVSSADDFDFVSNSSQAGPTVSSVGHEVDPSTLVVNSEHAVSDMFDCPQPQQLEYAGRETSVSDGDMPRLEGITLQSPIKPTPVPDARPSSPLVPPPSTAQRKPNRFVEALSTIRKPFSRRKGARKEQRVVSPTLDNPPMALKQPRLRAVTSGMPESPPNSAFVHGICDDPFVENPGQHPPARYFTHHGLSTPDESPAMPIPPSTSESRESTIVPSTARSISATPWPLSDTPVHAAPMGSEHWPAGPEYMSGHPSGWWDLNLLSQQGEFGEQHKDPNGHHYAMPPHHQHQHQHHHHPHHPHQQMEMSYEYGPPITDPGAAGLMIHMPQPQAPQPTVVNDLSLTAQTYLPPPPPVPATERVHRPPRAPSSGARHRNLSCSPMRKTRGPSASPTPGQSSRQSSGASISSVRSASGRLPASMPGTPCSVRKRRSREPAGAAGGGEVGFVNFTPNDGSLLMTGVAPSGSSKTKARREKEAQERRRRLSEAAIKAVAAAGGDVDKLVEQGFYFDMAGAKRANA